MESPLGRAAMLVHAALLKRIRHSEYREGEQLPAERSLAGEFGVARNTVRLALERLEQEGLLERTVGRGTFVRPGAGRAHRGEAMTLTSRMREASPVDLMEVRLIIEPHAAALAATRAHSMDFARIEDALRHSVAARGLAEFEHWDARLHLTIFEATKNAVLVDYCSAINAVRDEPAWYQLKKRTVTPELRLVYDREHSGLVQAITARDGEAARAAMRSHLLTVRNNLLGEAD